MNKEDILYYDGNSARPSPVRVLLFQGQLHLHNDVDETIIESFPAAATTQNLIGNTFYLYLDPTGTRYLQLHTEHPVATLLCREHASGRSNWAQHLMKQRIFVLLLATLGLGLGLYFLLVSLVPFLGMRIIGVQQEIAMGKQIKEAMLKQSGVIGEAIDSGGTVRIQQFAGQLQLSSTYPIEVTLLKSKTINAYALPGGQIVVYSGIVSKMKTPEELAALLAHEATHINERHSLRSLLHSAANGILISVIFSDASGISGAAISGVETLQGLQYSRALEAAADRKGMELMLANKVDVKGMKQLMQTLQQEEKLPNDLSFISSHPHTNERIKAAEKFIKDHSQTNQKNEKLQLLFNSVKSCAAAF